MNEIPSSPADGRTADQDFDFASQAKKGGKWRGMGFLLPMAILLAVLLWQWPMLKGQAYRVAGWEAPQSTIAWRTDFHLALNEGQVDDKPLLLVFGASWCPPCVAMKHDVWPDDTVERTVENGFIPVYIDIDDAGSREIAARYGVRGIPSVLVVDGGGKLLREAAFMSKAETLRFLSDTAS